MKQNYKTNKKHKIDVGAGLVSAHGITLISLVITIIILIILAGVSINLVLGQNGIIGRAKQAKQDYEQAVIDEETQLNELYAYMTRDDLPENTPENPQDVGTIVKLPTGWATETAKYIKTSDGSEATEVTKIATVYAVSVGNGETVPVPGNGVDKGFYYVGGTLDTGVIISDNRDDRYGYNPETKQENDTTLDKTTYEYTTNLKGNQFIWIPCSASLYKKSNSWNGTKQTNSSLANTWWDTTTPKAELSQIEKYGGFYVGRYEAGLADTITEFTENQKHTNSNQIYNKDGIPQSKAGVIPWMFIDWEHAKANAESMYSNNYVSSGLITGTQWDVTLNTMLSKTAITSAELINSENWGNYKNKQLTYTGRKANASHNGSNWIIQPFGTQTTNGTKGTYANNVDGGELLTTGASSTTERYHIFDWAGNLWEWTEETSFYGGNTSTEYRVCRGGSCVLASGTYPACYRHGGMAVCDTNFSFGFRVVLYMK